MSEEINNNDGQTTEQPETTEQTPEVKEVDKETKEALETTKDKEVSNKGNTDNKGNTGSKTEVIRFKLKDNKLMWSTPSKSIELNAFKQKIGSEIRKDDEDYKYIEKAIKLDVLEVVEDGSEFPAFKTKDLSYGKVQEEALAKTHYNTEEYLHMLQDDVIDKVRKIDDPKLLIKLIQAEKKGENKEHNPRGNVISTMRQQLKKINVNGVYDIELDDI